MASNRVLLLGAGFVAGPVVRYMAKHNIPLTVASRTRNVLMKEVERLAVGGAATGFVQLNVDAERDRLEQLISQHDLTISLLPYSQHLHVAKLCIKHKKHMVTSSYLSPELKALDEQAKEAGITVMNEAGMDPGIDHMLAQKCIDEAHEKGAKVVSFKSFCGALPAPEHSENVLRYKFSWSPRGVLLAHLNAAKYLEKSEVVEVAEGGALLDHLLPIDFLPGFALVGYPNRNSLIYDEIYNIKGEVKTLFRGTLRYKGFIEAFKALKSLGLIDGKEQAAFSSKRGQVPWKELLTELIGAGKELSAEELKQRVIVRLGKEDSLEFKAIRELGLLSDTKVACKDTPLDTLAGYLADTLNYAEGERDMVVLNHDVEIENTDGKQQLHRIQLVHYGDPEGFSTMATTVGYTTAITSKLVVQGFVKEKGMTLPIQRYLYEPILQELEGLGVKYSTKIMDL